MGYIFHKTNYLSPIGLITLVCDEEGDKLVVLQLETQKNNDVISGKLYLKDDLPIFTKTKNWLDRYFTGEKPNISDLPISLSGSEFRLEVWNILREIPYGEVITYGNIAKMMAAKMNIEKMSAQAVGGAVSHNPIPIIIPCHRVIGVNGKMTGYSGGLDTKIKLLRLEGIDV